MANMSCPCVVKHNNQYFMAWKKLGGKMHLISQQGKKMPGTPSETTVEYVQNGFEEREYNGHKYFKTKIGVFSLSTGNKIKMPDILALFEKPAEKKPAEPMCTVCGVNAVDPTDGHDTCPNCIKIV